MFEFKMTPPSPMVEGGDVDRLTDMLDWSRIEQEDVVRLPAPITFIAAQAIDTEVSLDPCFLIGMSSPAWALQVMQEHGIRFHVFDQSRAGSAEAGIDGNSFVLGFVKAFSETSQGARLQRLAVRHFPPQLQAGAVWQCGEREDPVGLLSWIVARSVEMTRYALEENGRNIASLAQTRAHLRDNAVAFNKLEAHLQGSRVPRCWLAFEVACDAKYVSAKSLASGPDASEGPIVVRQVLPTLLAHHAAICLRLRHTLINGCADVRVRLVGAYAGDQIASWRCSFDEIGEGWTRFELAVPTAELREPAILEIEVDRAFAQSLLIGLGRLVPLPGYAAEVEGQPSGERPLALRAFEGIPGLPGTPALGSIVDLDEASAELRRESSRRQVVPREALERVRQVRPAVSPQGGSNPVEYYQCYAGVQVHPLREGYTIAVIENIRCQGYDALSCHFQHANVKGFPIDFGVSLRTWPSLEARQGAAAEPQRPDLFRRLQGGQSDEIYIDLPAGAEVLDLYLFTSSPTHKIDYGWAVFSGVMLHGEAVAADVVVA